MIERIRQWNPSVLAMVIVTGMLSAGVLITGCAISPGTVSRIKTGIDIASVALDVAKRAVPKDQAKPDEIAAAAGRVINHIDGGGELSEQAIFGVIGSDPNAVAVGNAVFALYKAETRGQTLSDAAKRELILRHARNVRDAQGRNNDIEVFAIEGGD